MVTLNLILIWLSFYLFYLTSKKAQIARSLPIEKWMHNHAPIAKVIGTVLLFLSLSVSISLWGVGSGSLFFFIILMTLGSLVTIISPLRVLNYVSISAISILSFVLEIILP
ncbi:hypothetical protein N6H18_18550 [Reichenbachiella agarivorans]|uniref:DoxX-like family protein n=1 Tax=Reichenbachiella agarivorans TaxID=2979464 RepID=A0ABY6CP97_9BACT|nr:hypothetical protein [Reichenbachiella agarivorans]UXP32343.1 hypothetical protein N6H18_18550 [Reichenbachiella agarivorans]